MCGVFGDNRSVRISPASSSIMHATTERAWTSRPTHIRSDSTGASRKCGTTTPAWRRPAPTYERGAGPTYGLGLFDQITDLIQDRDLTPVTLDEMFGTSRAEGRD